jgi:hypothetical protein
MMDREQWFVMATSTAAVWHESGENPAVFCYLITWDAFTMLRSHVVALIPYTARHQSACWNPSFTSSVRSTIPKGSEN